nr:translation initiation factor IF-2-like [Aegilops tauschii subsp. strangulata]
MDYPIIQYADDTLLLMPACAMQAAVIKKILVDYADSIGLKINFHKSTLIPINVEEDLTNRLAAIFECSVGSLPFTYLGLPMGTSRPSIHELMPLLPPKLIEMLDKIKRCCLWIKKTDRGEKWNSLAAWDMPGSPRAAGHVRTVAERVHRRQPHRPANPRAPPQLQPAPRPTRFGHVAPSLPTASRPAEPIRGPREPICRRRPRRPAPERLPCQSSRATSAPAGAPANQIRPRGAVAPHRAAARGAHPGPARAHLPPSPEAPSARAPAVPFACARLRAAVRRNLADRRRHLLSPVAVSANATAGCPLVAGHPGAFPDPPLGVASPSETSPAAAARRSPALPSAPSLPIRASLAGPSPPPVVALRRPRRRRPPPRLGSGRVG